MPATLHLPPFLPTPSMNSSVLLRSALALLTAVSLDAQARDTVLHLPLADALADPAAQRIVGTTPLRFGASSAAHADLVARDVTIDGTAAPLRENAARRDSHVPSDESVCAQAFVDAMKRLVDSARQSGAGAVVGIVWDYKGQVQDDPARYECHAGSFRSHVALRAQFARAMPPASGQPGAHVALANLDAVPSTPAGKERYAHFLTLPKPRAFALTDDGSWRFWADTPDAVDKLFDDCARLHKRCWLYAVDDSVVWDTDEPRRIASAAQWRSVTAPMAPKDEHQ